MFNLTARSLELVRRMRRAQVEWLEAADAYAKEGYRPQFCIHGTNQWTDYDNICGGCEEGAFTAYTRGMDLYRYARDVAEGAMWSERARWKKREQRLAEIAVFADKKATDDLPASEIVRLIGQHV